MAQLETFGFKPGRILLNKYEIISQLGSGWEAEVYLLRELDTKIERAAKFFFPHRNPKNKATIYYAKKLHKLRHCPVLVHYHTQENMRIEGQTVKFLVSEYVEGELLSRFLKKQPGERLSSFQALHLLYAMARGLEDVHALNEYHGDLHTDNIIVQRYGLGFDLKILDVYQWAGARPENIFSDVTNMIRIFYDSIGGQRHYAKQPQAVKELISGLKSSLIRQKFRTAGQLRLYLEKMAW